MTPFSYAYDTHLTHDYAVKLTVDLMFSVLPLRYASLISLRKTDKFNVYFEKFGHSPYLL